jgi:hypothetical protein
VSFPAPPLPLTEQERLLLRIAHRGDPVELAMLDPKMRAARDEEDKAEVQRFFVQPKVQMDPEQGGSERTATAGSVAGGEERQQQIPSGDDNQKNNDNSESNGNDNRKSNGNDNQKSNDSDAGKSNDRNDRSPAPELKAEPTLSLPAVTRAVPQKTPTGENR